MKFYRKPLTIAGIFLSITCFAQPENYETADGSILYCKFYAAYGLITPGSFKGVSNNDNNDVNVVDIHKKGMGGGIRAGFGIGMILNEYLNVGIDGEYLLGNRINVKVNSVEGSLINTQSIITYDHSVVSIIPNVVFKVISKPKYYIYNRLGIMIGIPVKVTESELYKYQYSDPRSVAGLLKTRDIETSFSGKHILKTSIGYQAALGAQMKLSERLRGFFEMTVYGITFNRVQYEDSKRITTQTDQIKDQAPKVYEPDLSRYINKYQGSGVTINRDTISGTKNNYLFSTTSSQAPFNMNAITLGVGIVIAL